MKAMKSAKGKPKKAMPAMKPFGGKGKPGGSAPSGSEYPEGKFGGGTVTDRGKKR